MKTKPIPAIITLIAALITCVVSFLNQLSMGIFVRNLCLVIVIFFILGSVIRFIIERNFRKQPQEQEEINSQEEMEPTEKNAQPKETGSSKDKGTTEEKK